ncbi:peptidoglycan D,D-transpeptidase FtsI family protein [Nakamurella leprariae]|uniref:Cell division protein FtsI n=1 Tax=Nakamurella leprariae TaxID=2803911 RepID=A0A938YB50_9ACTN|nr:penicillin-binding protein 2 [Nakamurella leprariae]MBM9469245.1 cell division protein FtsI [Nakamurella leprariae]
MIRDESTERRAVARDRAGQPPRAQSQRAQSQRGQTQRGQGQRSQPPGTGRPQPTRSPRAGAGRRGAPVRPPRPTERNSEHPSDPATGAGHAVGGQRPGSGHAVRPGRVVGPSRADRTDRAGRPDRSDRTGRSRTERPARSGRAAQPRSVRGRRTRRSRVARANLPRRGRLAMVALVVMLVAVGVKLISVQVVDSHGYAAQAVDQRSRLVTLAAQRGSISDRTGAQLAFTVEGRAVAARPALFTDDTQRRRVAELLAADLADTGTTTAPEDRTADALMDKLSSDSRYVYLARGLMPAEADVIIEQMAAVLDDDQINAVVTERQDIREAQTGSAAAAIVGTVDFDGNGLSGIESKFDGKLSGEDGSREVDVDARSGIIPGSARNEVAATDGVDITLTLDNDLQHTVAQYVQQRVTETGAKSGCAVVMTADSARIAAMACFEPGKSVRETGNKAVTDKFEPGSVNKVVTMAAALEQGLITPDTVLTVDGEIGMGDVTVHDAWAHGPIQMTVAGILAKSSNVGTLMIAQQIGPDAFIRQSELFGQGVKTGVQLPGETRGDLPAQSSWSSSTFANLPIGQGMTVNLVQLAGMYQAIANDGVRVTPTLVQSMTSDGQPVEIPVSSGAQAPGTQTRVMSAQTADTLKDMLRATVQDGDVNHRGTAPAAALTGYQVAGKTGTAQQVDEATGDYSDTLVTTTFGGVVPADDPRYAIALMLDAPNSSGPGGSSAAPLFHEIAAYLMRQDNVPPSPEPAPVYDLYVG